jgi:hypothetical protein
MFFTPESVDRHPPGRPHWPTVFDGFRGGQVLAILAPMVEVEETKGNGSGPVLTGGGTLPGIVVS